MDERNRDIQVSVPRDKQNRSEQERPLSEDARNNPDIDRSDSEKTGHLFGTIPIRAERKPIDPFKASDADKNGAEDIPKNGVEPQRTAPTCSQEHSEHTITIREAARIFEEAGVPRTERAITNWCNQNARGVARLDCCHNEVERKYYITPASIHRAVKEERKKSQYWE